LPGKIFPVAGQKKASVNHCYLSVAVEMSACRAGGRWYRVKSLPCGITFNCVGEPGRQWQTLKRQKARARPRKSSPRPRASSSSSSWWSGSAILGGGAATYFFFFRHHDEEAHAEMAPPPKPPVFVEVPDMLVNLAGNPGDRIQYLKVKVVLEVKEEKQIEAIKPSMPRVTDIFQTYLRELRPSDLNGSAGLFRLKEELTRRVNAAVAPIQVSAVLFKEIVVQ